MNNLIPKVYKEIPSSVTELKFVSGAAKVFVLLGRVYNGTEFQFNLFLLSRNSITIYCFSYA
jgi:hypothetical protein